MPLQLFLNAPTATITAADTDTRTLAGVALPYGEAGTTSAGRLVIDPGAVRVPDQLRRVKLFREHGRTTPVGYAVNATDTPTHLAMRFAVGRTPDGDTALLEAAEGIRDALSVELDNVAIEAGHVIGADLVAVAQVAVPAYAAAVLTGSTPDTPDPDTPNPDPDADEDADEDEDDPTEQETDPMPETTTAPPTRPVVDALGPPSPLTGMVIDSWKWETKPQVGPYAGNKEEIPTNPATIVPAQSTASRIAGGWDLDRIYLDFNTGFVEAFLTAAHQDYVKKSQTYFIDGHGAVTGPPAVPQADGIISGATDLGTQASTVAAVGAIVEFLTGNGANVSFLAMASDVYANLLSLNESEIPWWLKSQGSVNLAGGSAALSDVSVVVDPGMANGRVLGGDRSAVTLFETGPINVQALNLPNGGIDLALFGYWSQVVHDPAGLAKATATLTAATTRTATKSA
jgi:hypothetical protein